MKSCETSPKSSENGAPSRQLPPLPPERSARRAAAACCPTGIRQPALQTWPWLAKEFLQPHKHFMLGAVPAHCQDILELLDLFDHLVQSFILVDQ